MHTSIRYGFAHKGVIPDKMSIFKHSSDVAKAQACQDMRFFGDLIQAREEAGLTQEDVARRLDWPVDKVIAMEQEGDGRFSEVRDYAFACEAVVFSFVVPWGDTVSDSKP